MECFVASESLIEKPVEDVICISNVSEGATGSSTNGPELRDNIEDDNGRRLSCQEYEHISINDVSSTGEGGVSFINKQKLSEYLDSDSWVGNLSDNASHESSMQHSSMGSKSSNTPTFRSIDDIYSQSWKELSKLIESKEFLDITHLLDCRVEMKKTLLHILMCGEEDVPYDLVKKIIDFKPSLLRMCDESKNLPLHYAVESGKTQRIIDLLINKYPSSVGVKNSAGKTPIHIIASRNSYVNSSDRVSVLKSLVDRLPKAVFLRDNEGQTPLHNLCSKPQSEQKSVIEQILSHYSKARQNPTRRDQKGNTALHLAIVNQAPVEIVELFARKKFRFNSAKLFLQRNQEGNLPLHLSLLNTCCTADRTTSILNVAPIAASTPSSTGKMPVMYAVQHDLPNSLIKSLLLSDMPIEFEFNESKTSMLGEVSEKHHGGSWWFIACQCNDKYLDIIEEILERTTHAQILALARSLKSSDEQVRVIDVASERLRSLFSSMLRFHGRYELLPEEPMTFDGYDGDIEEYHACDHGFVESDMRNNLDLEIEIADSFCTTATFTSVFGDAESIEVCHMEKAQEYEVLIRRYLYEEDYLAEKTVRDRYNISSTHTEAVYNFCHEENNENNPPKENFIVFEKSDHTLDAVFSKISSCARSKKWINKCSIVLHQIATAVNHLHKQSLIHGNLDPRNVAKYGNRWKLINIGLSTKIGEPMRGPIRRSVPPESVSILESIGSPSLLKRSSNSALPSVHKVSRVTFSSENSHHDIVVDDYLSDSDNEKSSVTDNHTPKRKLRKPRRTERYKLLLQHGLLVEDQLSECEGKNISYSPEKCIASPSWDMWAFGLLMVQLLLGRSIHLPNFERADDALLTNLYTYNEVIMRKIHFQVLNVVGDESAADLVKSLLDPNPENRPSSFDEILESEYFKQAKPSRSPKKSSSNRNLKGNF